MMKKKPTVMKLKNEILSEKIGNIEVKPTVLVKEKKSGRKSSKGKGVSKQKIMQDMNADLLHE